MNWLRGIVVGPIAAMECAWSGEKGAELHLLTGFWTVLVGILYLDLTVGIIRDHLSTERAAMRLVAAFALVMDFLWVRLRAWISVTVRNFRIDLTLRIV